MQLFMNITPYTVISIETNKFALTFCLNFEVVCIDIKFGSNEFHRRIVDGKNDLENISRRHLGILYFKKILRL
jgi:hypothetical protein